MAAYRHLLNEPDKKKMEAATMKAVWQISCCDIREAALVLSQGTSCHIRHAFAIVWHLKQQLTSWYKMTRGHFPPHSTSFFGMGAKTFLHDFPIIDWAHPCRMALQKNVQHWIVAPNIRPVPTAKKILSPWCHCMKCIITDHVTALWENLTEFPVNHPWNPQEVQSCEPHDTSLS